MCCETSNCRNFTAGAKKCALCDMHEKKIKELEAELALKDKTIQVLAEACKEDLYEKIKSKWESINKAASKFYLAHLDEVGDEWDEFCELMNSIKRVSINRNCSK